MDAAINAAMDAVMNATMNVTMETAMETTMNPIFTRASVRTFTEEPVSEADIEQLMRAAMAAPSAANQQPWEFYYTTDGAVCEQLAGASRFAGPIKKAPLGIVVCQRKEGLRAPEYAAQDISAAIENLLLEATALGLGAVWMGIAPNEERMESAAKLAGLPENLEAFALIAVGHPAGEVKAAGPSRYEEARVHRI